MVVVQFMIDIAEMCLDGFAELLHFMKDLWSLFIGFEATSLKSARAFKRAFELSNVLS